MSEEPTSPSPKPAADLHGLDPRELLARGLDTAKPGASHGPWAAPTPEELAGPRYALGEQFSRGGMGGLWYARESATGRTIALKRILGRPDADSFRRFLSEARITARLEHPNIVPVHGLGTDPEGQPFYTMKLVQGTDLAGVLKQLAAGDREAVARYPLAQLLIIFQKVCDAVAFAHSRQVIHRDLKPANIMLGPFGEVLVMDWGLAKDLGETKAGPSNDSPGEPIANQQPLPDDDTATVAESEPLADDDQPTIARPERLSEDDRVTLAQPESSPADAVGTLPGQAYGSPHYMAPEQARGDIHLHDARTDIYALGAILYQILSLRYSVSGRTTRELVSRVSEGDLDPLVLPLSAPADEDADLSPDLRRSKIPRLALHHLPGSVIPESLVPVVLRAMAFKPERRYQSVPELQREITAYQNGFATSAERAGLGKQILLALRRNRREATVAGVLLAILLMLAVASFIRIGSERNLADRQRQRAEAAAIQARENLSQSDFLQALRLIEDHRDHDAVAQLTRSLSLNPRNNAALYRLTTLLMYHGFALPVSRMQHDNAIESAQFSPDGKWLVTASQDRIAQIWNAQSGKPRTDPLKHDAEVWSAEFSADGKRIVTASRDRTARVWDAQSGKPLTEPLRHDGYVVSAQFSMDGTRILTSSGDRQAMTWDTQVWDAKNGKLLTALDVDIFRVKSAEFSPDGKLIVTTARDGGLQISDSRSGKPLSKPLQDDRVVQSAHFSPDGKRIVTASYDKNACIWDVQSGKLLTAITHESDVTSAKFSPDGKRILTVSMEGAHVRDAQSGKQLIAPLKHDGVVGSAEFSADGKRIVTASRDRTVRVWDAQSGELLIGPFKLEARLGSAHFSPDGKWIVYLEVENAQVRDAKSGRPVSEWLRHDGQVESAHFSPDGKCIVTASLDGTARIWDARSGKLMIAPLKHDDVVQSARFSPDGKWIVTASVDTVRVWNAQSGNPLTASLKHDADVVSAHFSPDGKWIVTASGGDARVWDAQSGQPLTEPLKHNDRILSARFSPDGKWIVTASGGDARVWDAQSGQPLTEPFEHNGRIVSARFSSDGKSILTTAEDKTARVWELPPVKKSTPEWLARMAEAVVGEHMNDAGVLEPASEAPVQVLEEIRAQLSRAPSDDDWTIWGRWFLADRSTRTISPFSKITIPEYIESQIKENTPDSLDEAERLAVGNPEVLKRIASARTQLEKHTPASPPPRP